MMELNFFAPDQYRNIASENKLFFESALDDLEEYWDLEAPRFGEDHALGWKHKLDSVVKQPRPPLQASTTSLSDDDPFVTWAKEETQSALLSNRPARTIDEIDDSDDPYSVVLFSDLRSLLFAVTLQDSRLQLIYSFLFFLGLPLNPPDTSTATPLASDTFLYSDEFLSPCKRASFWPTHSSDDFLHALLPFDTIAGEAMEPIRRGALNDPYNTPFVRFPMSPDLLFQATPKWFCLLSQKQYLEELDVNLVR